MNDQHYLSQGSRGIPESGSGKGGHEPKSAGEAKGIRKHIGDEKLDAKIAEKDDRKG